MVCDRGHGSISDNALISVLEIPTARVATRSCCSFEKPVHLAIDPLLNNPATGGSSRS
jgi:hypothetical protein